MDQINMMKNELQLYKGKKIFITGHTGFKGTWMTFLLAEMGAEVMGYALEPEAGYSHFRLLELDKKITHITGDVRDLDFLNQTMLDFQPEIVFHLAAQPLVKRSYHDPVETFSTNMMGAVNILECVRNCSSVRSLVFITSDKCYENVEWIWGYRENDRVGGHDPYSASKGAAEIIFSAYLRSYFSARPSLGAASTRAGNVIGGGDWAVDRIIPDCIRSIQSDKAVELRNPKATRPWQHVLEPISGYLLLGVKLYNQPAEFSGSWNFGPSTSEVRTVHEVASKVIGHIGKGSVVITGDPSQHHEANLLQLNCDKAHQLLSWYPRWHVEETLYYTAEWYKQWMEGADISMLTKNQINQYFNNII